MADPLYDQLRAKDPGIARAYQGAMRGKPADAPLDKDGVAAVFAAAIRDKQITTREAEALVLVIDGGALTADAWSFLRTQLAGADGENALIRGTKTRLTTAAELDGFNRALALANVKQITFWSPGTASHYRPIHYQAVKDLVRAGKIKVFELRAAGLNVAARMGTGIYDEVANEFLLYQGGLTAPLIIHEATHAVQDWRDFSAADGFLEADAYIAEAVAMVDLGIRTGWTPPGRAAEAPAVGIVMAGRAVPGNADWTRKDGPYYKVVEAARAGAGSRNMKEAAGASEKDAMHAVMDALSNKKGGKHRYEL